MGEIVSVIVAFGIIGFYSRKQKPTGKVSYKYKVNKHNVLLQHLPVKVNNNL